MHRRGLAATFCFRLLALDSGFLIATNMRSFLCIYYLTPGPPLTLGERTLNIKATALRLNNQQWKVDAVPREMIEGIKIG